MPQDTPLSDAAEPHVNRFVENVSRRYQVGKRDYGDSSFNRPLESLITEIQEELEDVAGWSAIQWSRLEVLKQKIRIVANAVSR